MSIDVSIILPCYNDAGHLAASVGEILAILRETRWTYEIILIDDKSPGGDRGEIERIIAAHPGERILGIFHETNTGRGGAVNDGLRMAKGEVAGFLDVDLEVAAHYIPNMVRAIHGGADVAIGWRIYKFRWRVIHRIFLSRGYIWLVNRWLGCRFADTESGYKFFRREKILPVLDRITDNRWFWDTEVVVRAERAGLRLEFLPVLFLRRPTKPSTVRILRDTLDYLRNLWTFRRSLRREDKMPPPPLDR
jgi:glycosyltransferase involved in cell wall biosynthesis